MSHHPLIDRLITVTQAREVTPANVQDFEAEPGEAVLFFGSDPVRFPEVLDVAVVLPELRLHFGRHPVRCSGQPLRVGVVPRAVEDALARRYAVQRWPSLVFLRDGGWLGTVSGMKDWDDYVREVGEALAAEPTRRPAPLIAIHPAGGAACH